MLLLCFENCKHVFGPLKHKTVYNVVTDQLFWGIISVIVLIHELITELSDSQCFAPLNRPELEACISLLREIQEVSEWSRWLLCEGYAPICMQVWKFKTSFFCCLRSSLLHHLYLLDMGSSQEKIL